MKFDTMSGWTTKGRPMKPPRHDSPLTRRLFELMHERRINARALSDTAGLGATAVSDILHGRNKNPSLEVLQRIAAALESPELIGENLNRIIGEVSATSQVRENRNRAPEVRGDLKLRSGTWRLATCDICHKSVGGWMRPGPFYCLQHFQDGPLQELPKAQLPKAQLPKLTRGRRKSDDKIKGQQP